MGDICKIGGIAMLFFFRATGGRGGLATMESSDIDDGIDACNNNKGIGFCIFSRECVRTLTDTTTDVVIISTTVTGTSQCSSSVSFFPRAARGFLIKTISSCFSTTNSTAFLPRRLLRIGATGCCSSSLAGGVMIVAAGAGSIDFTFRPPRRFGDGSYSNTEDANRSMTKESGKGVSYLNRIDEILLLIFISFTFLRSSCCFLRR